MFPNGQRLMNTNGLEFAQTSGNVVAPWRTSAGPGTVQANVIAVKPGSTGNVGDHTITQIEDSQYDPSKLTVSNPQATGGGAHPSSTPQMTQADFDAAPTPPPPEDPPT